MHTIQTTQAPTAKPPAAPTSYPPTYHGDPDVSNLLPRAAVERLVDHGLLVALDVETLMELHPVLSVCVPFGGPAWLLVAIDADDRALIHGIHDDATGNPRMATFRLADMLSARGDAGLPAERDLHFRPDGDLAWHLAHAECHGTLAA